MNMHRTFFAGMVLVLNLLPLPGCALHPFEYSAEPIEAWVIDAETKQPLEGVIVTANWQLKGGLEGGNPVGQMMVLETVTDRAGRFHFPAWGPLARPREGVLRNEDPLLLLFKPGYRYQGLANPLREQPSRASVRSSQWNGQTIELKRFQGSLKEYAGHLSYLDTRLNTIVRSPDCDWKKIPRMMAAIVNQGSVFREKGVFNHLLDADSISSPQCGSAREFLRDYLQ